MGPTKADRTAKAIPNERLARMVMQARAIRTLTGICDVAAQGPSRSAPDDLDRRVRLVERKPNSSRMRVPEFFNDLSLGFAPNLCLFSA